MDLKEINSDPGSIRDNIMAFEEKMKGEKGAFENDNASCPLTHHFTDGIYTREIFIPKGMYLVGKIHKHAHPNFLMKGKVEVLTEGGGLETLEGPMVMVSPPGTKRALRVLEDCTWVTVHHNPENTQSLTELEELVIAKDYKEYDKFVLGVEKKGVVANFLGFVKKIFIKNKQV